jgi:2OG-Fe(II) oxygenase superfamily
MLPVVSANNLTAEDLTSLISGSVRAVRIPGYLSPQRCQHILTYALSSKRSTQFKRAQCVSRVGPAFFDTAGSVTQSQHYLSQATEELRRCREAFLPFMTPIDQIRLELDELWPHGAGLARIGTQAMFSGMIRVFEEGGHTEIHQDHVDWCASDGKTETQLQFQGQLGVNVYASVAEVGGRLRLWDKSLPRAQYHAWKTDGLCYGIAPEAAGEPSVEIAPAVGELILFDARKLHAVEEIKIGRRVAFSCFIGHCGPGSRLRIWS